MKKIGFIDYYIDEWHANKYPGWIDELTSRSGGDFAVAYAYAECDKLSEDSRTTEEWCRDFGVEQCGSIAELCEKSDYIVILAPSNPEKHLGFAKEALRYGKRTYIDKTFAPDLATAEEIFALSEQYGAPFFSSSALRYADELKGASAQSVLVTGGGGNYDEYIIHQIEMAVKILGIGADSVAVEEHGGAYISKIHYPDKRAATLVYGKALPFTVHTDSESDEARYIKIESDFFANLLADILNFFDTGEKSFPSSETLEVMRIREALIAAKNNPENRIEIKR